MGHAQEVFPLIPSNVNDSQTLVLLKSHNIDEEHVKALKEVSSSTEATVSKWLDISVRSFRNYQQEGTELKESIKERLLLLLSLFKYGSETLGSDDAFRDWLNTANFHFDGSEPIAFLNTVSGIRFTRDRLSAIAYGDHV